MKTYTITQADWNGTPEQERRWRFREASGPGEYVWNEMDSRYEPVPTLKREEVKPRANDPIPPTVYDFDKLGVGIGGINRYQPTAAEEMKLIEAQLRHAEREAKRVRKGPLPHGQLWEPCWCGTEPVCVDCFKCHKHCDC